MWFLLLHTHLLRWHTTHCMGLFIDSIELGIIFQLHHCISDSATVLWIPFIYIILGAYSSRSNLHWYTLSEVRTRASLVRLLRLAKTLIDFPHSIPLNSFGVSTMARSSIVIMLYFCCKFWIISCWRALLACYPELSWLPTVLRRWPCRSQKTLNSLDRLGLPLLQ